MSKAFASNDSDDEEADLTPAPVLPPGTRNYMLPSGFAALETERNKALSEKAGLNPALVEHQVRLKRLDRRIEYLTDRLNIAQIINPTSQPADRVLFGARVTVKDAKGREQDWRIVGVERRGVRIPTLRGLSFPSCTRVDIPIRALELIFKNSEMQIAQG